MYIGSCSTGWSKMESLFVIIRYINFSIVGELFKFHKLVDVRSRAREQQHGPQKRWQPRCWATVVLEKKWSSDFLVLRCARARTSGRNLAMARVPHLLARSATDHQHSTRFNFSISALRAPSFLPCAGEQTTFHSFHSNNLRRCQQLPTSTIELLIIFNHVLG